MSSSEGSVLRFVAMTFTPLALPHTSPPAKGMEKEARRQCKLIHRKYLQQHMDCYINRSAKLLLWMFAFYTVSGLLLPFPYLTALSGITVLVSLLHLFYLFIYKQVIDDSVGQVPPEEPEDFDAD